MSEKNKFQKLTSEIITVEDVYLVKSEIRKFEQATYKIGQRKIGREFSALFVDLLKKIGDGKKLGRGGGLGVLKEISQYLEKLPRVRIELAFRPEKEFIEKVVTFFEKAIGEKVILDIGVRENLVGGAVIEYGGYVRDYSLRTTLKQSLETVLVKEAAT